MRPETVAALWTIVNEWSIADKCTVTNELEGGQILLSTLEAIQSIAQRKAESLKECSLIVVDDLDDADENAPQLLSNLQKLCPNSYMVLLTCMMTPMLEAFADVKNFTIFEDPVSYTKWYII